MARKRNKKKEDRAKAQRQAAAKAKAEAAKRKREAAARAKAAQAKREAAARAKREAKAARKLKIKQEAEAKAKQAAEAKRKAKAKAEAAKRKREAAARAKAAQAKREAAARAKREAKAARKLKIKQEAEAKAKQAAEAKRKAKAKAEKEAAAKAKSEAAAKRKAEADPKLKIQQEKKAASKTTSKKPTPKPTPTLSKSKPKPKADAILAIKQDKGKLKPNDVKKITKSTGLSKKQVVKLAINKVTGKKIAKKLQPKPKPTPSPFKPKKAAISAIEQDKGKLKPRDVQRISTETGLSTKKILKITGNKVPDKVISGKIKSDKGDKGKDKRDTTIKDLKSDLEEAESKIKDFPGADGGKLKGKDFKKYKPQAKKIREAAEADLALRLAKKTEPKTLKKAETLKSKFEKGRAKREKQLAKISDAKRPKFKDYKQAVKDIRKGGGAAKEYAYSGKFEKLGKKLGVKYGEQKREKRTERRFASLIEGLKNKKLGRAYSTASDTAKTQRDKGRKAMKLFRGESVA